LTFRHSLLTAREPAERVGRRTFDSARRTAERTSGPVCLVALRIARD